MTRVSRRLEVVALPAALVLLAACGDLGTEPGVRASAATASAGGFGVCNADFPDLAGWNKVFEDKFDQAALSKWKIWYGGAFNNELQLYQEANLEGEGSGQLSILAKRQTVLGPTSPYDATQKSFEYTSGRIESATTFSAGRVTPRVRMLARVRMPTGYGMWPAFWSYGDPWPTQGEIDVVEARGNEPFQYQTNYFYGRRRGYTLVSGQEGYVFLSTEASLTSCFHVFEVEWTKNALTFYLDGEVVDIKSGGYIPNMFGKQQRVVLNLAVGGVFFASLDASKIAPGTMVVDWVKVFTRN